jgi:hypothetical protein
VRTQSVFSRRVSLSAALVVSLLVCSVPVSAQELPRFRALLRSGQTVEGTRGTMSSWGLRGSGVDGARIEIPRQDLQALDSSRGTRARRWALFGAALGAFIGLSYTQSVSSSPYGFDDEAASNGLIATAVLCGGGALVGGALGATRRVWEPAPLPPLVQQPTPRRQSRPSVAFSLRF